MSLALSVCLLVASCLNHGNIIEQRKTKEGSMRGELGTWGLKAVRGRGGCYNASPNSRSVCVSAAAVIAWRCTYLLFLSLLGHVALLQAHGAEKVSEVAKQGDDAKAHVCHDGDVHGRLLKDLMPEPLGRPCGPCGPGAVLLHGRRERERAT